MARKKSKQLTEVEQTIMDVLWRCGPSSVRQIADEVKADKPMAYTTVQTMCKILTDKGYTSFVKEGRAFIYNADISRAEVRRGALSSMIDQFFGGSPKVLAQHLMEESDLKSSDMQELQELIDKASRKEGKK